MKSARLPLCLLLTVSLLACETDDDTQKGCTQADWVGTYEGVLDCDGTEENVTVTITADSTDAINIFYETMTHSVGYNVRFMPDGCSIAFMDSGGGITIMVDASLDGDQLSFADVYSAGGNTETCEIAATRQ